MREKEKLLAALSEALSEKQKSCAHYEYLAEFASEKHVRETSKSILVSEKQHLELLSSLVEKMGKDGFESNIVEGIDVKNQSSKVPGMDNKLKQELMTKLFYKGSR
jgi:rubrerythrin